MAAFPEAPPNLKAIQPYLKIAVEHDQRDIVGKDLIYWICYFLHRINSKLNLHNFSVAYWARVYSLQLGIKASKQPDEKVRFTDFDK